MTEAIPGRATPEGTRRGCAQFEALARPLGRTGLTVSPVGFGGYRVHVGSPVHHRALSEAIRLGINLVDTSTNYTDGGSESLVGTVLADQAKQTEGAGREQIVVVSKVGYIQGRNLEHARGRQPGYPDVVEYHRDCWHCIHPEFLADQLAQSRQRTALSTLDVYLLHNPEYFFMARIDRGQPVGEADREEFYRRIRAAFEYLEHAVAEGAIAWYGVSSNTFVEPADRATFVDLQRLLSIAHEVGGPDHHFAVVQMPLNLMEPGAVLEANGPGGRSVLEVAAEADLAVATNRPLNAIVRGQRRQQLLRLADPAVDASAAEGVDAALRKARKLEGEWASGLGKRLRIGEHTGEDLFRWGQELSQNLTRVTGMAAWKQLRHEVIAPHLGQASAGLLQSLQGADRKQFAEWWERYGTAMHELFAAIEASIGAHHRQELQPIGERLDPRLPDAWRSRSTSQKAVLSLLAQPAVTCVLVGMREPRYVHDLVEIRGHPPDPADVSVDLAGIAGAAAS